MRNRAAYKRAMSAKLAADPWCQAPNCNAPATQVHHVEPIKDAPHRLLDPTNLKSVCAACHAAIEGKGWFTDSDFHTSKSDVVK